MQSMHEVCEGVQLYPVHHSSFCELCWSQFSHHIAGSTSEDKEGSERSTHTPCTAAISRALCDDCGCACFDTCEDKAESARQAEIRTGRGCVVARERSWERRGRGVNLMEAVEAEDEKAG